MNARLYFLPPAFLLVVALLRPSVEPVHVPRAKQRPPPVFSASPEPRPVLIPPAGDLAYLHRGIDRGEAFAAAPASPDLNDPDIRAIQRKLDTMIVDLRFDSATLEDILSYLRDFSGVDILLDAKGAGSVRLDPRMSVRTRDWPLGEVLDFVLSLQGMVYHLTEEKVVLVCDRVHPDRY